jgi:hypothetical protein
MEFMVDIDPKECLDTAEAYMVGREGYKVESRTQSSVSFSGRGSFRKLSRLSQLVFVLFVLSGPLFIVLLYLDRWKASLTAVADEGGKTRLMVGGETQESRKLLEQWVSEELTRRGLRQS